MLWNYSYNFKQCKLQNNPKVAAVALKSFFLGNTVTAVWYRAPSVRVLKHYCFGALYPRVPYSNKNTT